MALGAGVRLSLEERVSRTSSGKVWTRPIAPKQRARLPTAPCGRSQFPERPLASAALGRKSSSGEPPCGYLPTKPTERELLTATAWLTCSYLLGGLFSRRSCPSAFSSLFTREKRSQEVHWASTVPASTEPCPRTSAHVDTERDAVPPSRPCLPR